MGEGMKWEGGEKREGTSKQHREQSKTNLHLPYTGIQGLHWL